ncbi:MAG: protein translocase subunit SecDF [bacterium]|nr:protein translocase subunit SecDF [bacterium]MDD6026808.1 protein translocase subunit SecDF [bacterium]
MQSKGFIRVITACLVLVCIFYLSFSFVSNHYENKAVEFAQAMSKTTDVSNDAYKTYYKSYIDSIANEKVYLNWRTFQEVREMELGLGLDLKGGMNVTLQISVPDILKALSGHNPDAKFNRAIAITDSLHRDEKDYVAAFVSEYKKIGDGSLSQIFRNVEKVKHGMTDDQVAEILKEEVGSMVDNSYNVLRTRIDGFGVVAPNIQKLENTGRILLELPGIKEPERVRKLLQGSANLEFYETYTISELQNQLASLSAAAASASVAPADTTAAPADSAAVAAPKEATRTLADMLWANGQMGGPVIGTVHVQDTAAVNAIMHSAEARRLLPTNLKACWSVKALDEKGRFFNLVALKTNQGRPALGGDVVVDASSDYENLQGNVVSMTMNDTGARQWARVTQQNLNKSVAIVLDDQVYSYPNVNSVIEGGRSQITGNFTPEEAKDLANVLKSGKMAARVNIASESVIGPSLGQESIEAGFWSFIVALVLLVIFMYVGYGFAPGCVANLGLLLNLFFTLGILASFQAVLTLPGIAGIVLTLGTAVDANVLIFERTKEELRAGKGVKAAVADGYKNAFSAIFDSNLTSVITGIILFFNGSGPIKGFATTYIIGIACSFFTAVFATRLVMEWIISKPKFQNITFNTSISRKWFQGANFDFIGSRKRNWTVVGAIVVVAGILLAVRGMSMGIDFSGGRNYVIQFPQEVSTVALQEKLQAKFGDANVKVITIDNETKVRVSTNYKIDVNDPNLDDEIAGLLYEGCKEELQGMSVEDFSQSNEEVGIVQSEKVGPSIAGDMTREAVWAVIFSLIAMALYILLRFRNIAFSIGALAAVAFTAFVIIGIYGLYGLFPFSMEIDQTFIAAILTVIGYQVNDTVVVFDRVRETRTLYPKQDMMVAFNNALNSTLARTMMTSLSTLLVLVVIFILGGESIRSFVFAMLLGVIIGTCASLFIAAPTAYALAGRKQAKK